MATYAERLTFVANNTGSFRTFVSASEAAFARMGLVNTNASGTIDFNTVTPPNVANQLRGFSVWRFNDALQTTSPVFLRVDYGSSAAQAANPRITMQAARNADITGTLFDSPTTRVDLDISNLSVSGTMVGSGGNGYTWLAFRVLNTPAIIGVERGTLRTGDTSPAEVYLWAVSTTTGNGAVTAHYNWDTGSLAGATSYPGNTGWIPFFFYDETSTAANVDGDMSLSSAPAALLNFNKRNVGLPTTLIAAKRFFTDATIDVLTVAPYGVNQQYINLGNTFVVQQLPAAEFSLLARWE